MYNVYAKLGDIYDYIPIQSEQLFCVHNTNLDTSLFKFNLTLNQQQFDTFIINYVNTSTFKYFQQKPQTASLSFWTPRGNVDINHNQMRAICSVFKVTVVLEYARQSTEGDINPQACIPLDYINRYYMPHVDSGHKAFLDTVTGNCSKLDDIVTGMIKFSSNANTEYLTDLLGADKIDKMISSVGMNHSQTLYVVSSMVAMNNTKKLPYNEYINYLKTLTPEWTRQQSFLIHSALKDKTLQISDEFYLDPKVIDIHVELLEKSTTQSYRQLMQKISTGYFGTEMSNKIYDLFDAVDRSSEFAKANFVHTGAKGGSANYPGMTNAALAVSGYAIMKNSTEQPISYALVYNGLEPATFTDLLLDMNMFILALEFSQYYVFEFVKRLQPSEVVA